MAQEFLDVMEVPQWLVYYVSGNYLYIAQSWKSEFVAERFEEKRDKISLEYGTILIPVE